MLRAWIAVHRGLAALSVRRFGPRYAAALLRYADHLPLLKGPPPEVRLRYAERAVAAYRACEAGTELARALAVVARYLLRLGRSDEALAAAREGVAADDRDPDARHALALVLHHLDRTDESLAAAQAAVDLYRARVDDDPRRLSRCLAEALDTAARGLMRLGRHEEALAAYSEAAELFDRTPFLLQMPYFMRIRLTQVGLVAELHVAGRHEEALTVGRDALDRLDPMVALVRRRALACRAPLLRQLASCHAALGHRDEALSTAEKAVRDYRRLGAVGTADPAGLAWALDCLADQQRDLGRHAGAAEALREAIEVRTRLAAGDPATHQADLADTWGSLSNRLWDLGEQTGAIDANRESAAAYRLTADHEPALADVLSVLSARLHTAGRATEAVAAGREAVAIGRRLAENDAETHDPLLGRCLSVLAGALNEAEQVEDSLTVAEEAAALRRRLAAQDRSHDADLARSLQVLFAGLVTLGRSEDAIAAGREIVETYRRLAVVDLRERVGLCEALHDLAILLSGTKRHRDAVDVMDESIRIRTLLVADDPADHEPDLGRALRQRSYDLHAAGRRAEALPDIDAAIELFRRLAAADPAEHLLNAAYTLWQAARQRAGAGEAVEHLRELYDLSRRHDSPEVHRIVVGAFEKVYQDPDEVERAWRQITGTPYRKVS